MSVFAPGGTISLAATTSSGAAKLVNPNAQTVRVYNSGVVPVFIKAGTSSVTAATTDLPVAPGAVEVFDLKAAASGAEMTHIAGITGSGSATVYFTTGMGE